MAALVGLPQAGHAQEIRLLQRQPDPYGYPRPAPGETEVPVATSLFFQLGFQEKESSDLVLPDSISVRVGPVGGPSAEVLKPGRVFAEGYTGEISSNNRRGPALAVYLDGGADLKPLTTYVVSVAARSRAGAVLPREKGSWRFTTGAAARTHLLSFQLDLSAPSVRWQGGFFTGFCKPSFCTSASNRIPGYELMDRIRKQSPKAWSLQRDFTLTGMERRPRFLSGKPPNVVRERETRRIVAMEERDNGILVHVEDFFGHQQYGIESDRPLRQDYHPGDEVLIGDGVASSEAKVLEIVEDAREARRLLVTPFEGPADGWKLEYAAPLPEQEDADAPGLFPPGGCYLFKLRPSGTPYYYWGRVDKEWDLACRRFQRRLVVNFVDAPGDLSVDGRDFTYPKDYVQYHGVVYAFTAHVIDRYGDACLDFLWSVFNEPDLSVAFWRSGDWTELQKFYDYTVDAVLRAFEDRGYDSRRVMVGGLEIGAIFGTHIEHPVLGIFLAHCSPRAHREGALAKNAAFGDARLDGKRSKRVEELCRTNGGRGSPCDFISVHAYNASALMAAKLIRAKEIALEIDEAYYADLWVNSHECCPDWAPPPDVAAADSYLGNGYFPTWCADVARRQLQKASQDARFAFGESILTFWPWPNSNFRGHNNATRVIAVDQDGDGQADDSETVAMPILHFLGLLSGMGDAYRVLPEVTVGPHLVSGIASQEDNALRVLLYAHNARDVQSRSEDRFEITLKLQDVPWPKTLVREYRYDQQNNSYFELGLKLRERLPGGSGARPPGPEKVQALITQLMSTDPARQLAAIKETASLPVVPEEIVAAAFQLYERTSDEAVRKALVQAAQRVATRQVCYTPAEVERVRDLSTLTVTSQSHRVVDRDGALQVPLTVAANGANFVIVQSQESP
jgi:hypothetical protein